MSTKAELIADLDGEINAVGKVTKTRHTDANEFMVDEFYPDTFITDTSVLEVYTEVLNSSVSYTVNLLKTGKNVRAWGEYQNTTQQAISFGTVIYVQKTNQFEGENGGIRQMGIECVYLNGRLTALSPLAPMEKKYFSITYTAKD
jgi:hypothetical protein